MVSLPHDIAVTNFSRPILSRMAWNNSRGTATSAIWNLERPADDDWESLAKHPEGAG